jgi:hypothetical protein
MAQHVATKRKPATAALYRHALDRYILPELGRRKASELTRADITRLHHQLRDKPFLANRVVAVVGSMFAWAGEHGLVPEGYNPTLRIEKYREDRRERFLSVDELECLGGAIREAETEALSGSLASKNLNQSTSRGARTGESSLVPTRRPLYGCCFLRVLGCGKFCISDGTTLIPGAVCFCSPIARRAAKQLF